METVELIIHNRKNLQVNSENCQCSCLDINMLEGLRVLLGIPIHLIILLIGIPLYNIDYIKLKTESIKLIQQKIENEIKGQNGQKYQDVQFLYYLKTNKNQFLSADFNFQEDIELLSLAKQIQDGTLQIASEDAKEYIKSDLQEKLYDSLFKRIQKHYQSKIDLDQEIIKSLENNYRAFVTMYKHMNFQVQNSRNYGKPESILKDLKKQKCDKQYELGNLIYQELKRGISIFEEMGIKNRIKEVSKVNRLEFTYFRPRIVRQIVNGQPEYSADWVKQLKVSTSFYFWKIFFFFAASFFMIHKFMYSCLYFAIYSPCGLKAALYPKQFAASFQVNPRTGKIEDDPNSMEDTVTTIYQDIKNKAKQNIENFENEPDHGLLGKSITRICNRIENWFLRYFILGFICTNILLRIIFILIGIISLILVPLSLVLAPFYTLLCLIVCLFCIDFTAPNNHQSWDLPIFAPLIDLLVWRVFVRGVGQIIMSIVMIGFHITFGIILIIFGILIYIFRRLMDSIVFLFIWSCGRIPGGDSYIAYRISKQNRYLANQHDSNIQKRQNNEQIIEQLTFEQIQQIIDAEFHKEVLDQYKVLMTAKINQPMLDNDIKLKEFLQYLPFDFQKNKISEQYNKSADGLKSELIDQINQRKKQLPTIQKRGHQNYKYKHEDILSIFYQLQQYMSEKYGQKPFYSKFMWKTYKTEINNYPNLVLYFLNFIFFDGKSQINQVMDKLTLKEQKNSPQIKQQFDEFLAQKFKTNGKLKEAPQFITFSSFIERALKRLEPSQPLLSLRTDDFMRCEDFMFLNTTNLKDAVEKL